MPTNGPPRSTEGPERSGEGPAPVDGEQVAVPAEGGPVPAQAGEAAEEETGPDPLRFHRWMTQSATGAVLTGVALGLKQALVRHEDRPAYVVDSPGEPADDAARLQLRFDPDDPTRTIAVVRADAASPTPPAPAAAPTAEDEGRRERGPQPGSGPRPQGRERPAPR
ncbi:MAG TPA: hypothetical protein VKW77_08310 [Acidimicrobiales bacterium]|nr:hypothetical protein [Acidimicrobiales bacterium]